MPTSGTLALGAHPFGGTNSNLNEGNEKRLCWVAALTFFFLIGRVFDFGRDGTQIFTSESSPDLAHCVELCEFSVMRQVAEKSTSESPDRIRFER